MILLTRFKKVISLFLLLAVLTVPLSGCSLFLKNKGGSKKKIALTYYRFGDDAEAVAPLLQSYQTAHPGVTIQLVTKFSSFEQYEDTLINQIAEGEGPDLFSVPNTWIYKHQKIISPVPENLATVDQFRQTFVATADRDLVRPSLDGSGKLRIFGIPLFVDTLAVFYNKLQYEDRIPSRGRPASLWKDFLLDSISLTKSGEGTTFDVAGAALGRTDNIIFGLDVLYALILQHAGSLYSPDGASAFVRTGFSDALNFFVSFSKPGSSNFTWGRSSADLLASKDFLSFATGKVSTIFGYSDTYDKLLKLSNSSSLQSNKPISASGIGIAPLPQIYDADSSVRPRVSYARYNFETVSRNSTHKNEAWDLLLFLGNKKNQELYHQKTRKPTSRRDLLDVQSKDPLYGVFAEQVGYSQSLPLYHQLKVDNLFHATLSDIVDRSLSAKDASLSLENGLNLLLPPGGFTGPGPHAQKQ